MIVASGIELRAGARLLLAEAAFTVAEGDRIGLVGRNGAGKTTLAKVLSGKAQPAAGRSTALPGAGRSRRTRPCKRPPTPRSTCSVGGVKHAPVRMT